MKRYKTILACLAAAGAAAIALSLSSCASTDNLSPRYGEGWGNPSGGYGHGAPAASVPC